MRVTKKNKRLSEFEEEKCQNKQLMKKIRRDGESEGKDYKKEQTKTDERGC